MFKKKTSKLDTEVLFSIEIQRFSLLFISAALGPDTKMKW